MQTDAAEKAGTALLGATATDPAPKPAIEIVGGPAEGS
jgi:hypothetical protein